MKALMIMDFLSLLILNFFLTPVLAFTIYFCFLHSIRHSISLVFELDKSFKIGFKKFIIRAIPLTSATIVIFLVAIYSLNNFYKLDEAIYKVIFIGLASLTFPHILLEYFLEKMKKELKIFLASPRGFCAGVDRAIEIVNKALDKFGSPVYVRHEIVHNKQVVEDLKKRGAIFVEELSEIKDSSRPVIFSAHGVPKSVPIDAKNKKLNFVDATCPLVSKVHRESEQLHKNGYDIILIGHNHHPEVIGTMGQLPNGSIKLVETINDAKTLDTSEFKKPLAYITQTTLSVDDTKNIIDILKNKFPNIKGPVKEDICYATTNRQKAVKEIAKNCDLFFIIGSRNSSNSVRLVEVAKNAGCKKSILMHHGKQLPLEDIKKSKAIGISSGASAPEELVQNLINELKLNFNVSIEEIKVAEEKVTFKLPKELN